MFQFPGSFPFRVPGLQPGGLPHSDTRGSTVVCTSPRLFAAYHVLRHRWEPRHPPCALLLLPSPRPAPLPGAGLLLFCPSSSRLVNELFSDVHRPFRQQAVELTAPAVLLPHWVVGRLGSNQLRPRPGLTSLYASRFSLSKKWRIRDSNP